MKNIGRWFVLMGIGVTIMLMPSSARAEDCLEVGWVDKAGGWTYYKVFDMEQDANHLKFRYDYKHGKMDLAVTEKEKGDGEDVYVFKGEWKEEHGRAGGKVRMVLQKGHKHAKGFYTNGGWDSTHFDLKFGDCTHVK